MSTKSGTNATHGALFEFVRNADMDAKNFFDRGNAPIPPFKRNQYGATASGPIIKDRLFWLFSWEGLRERKALTRTGTLPNAAERAGDFSSLATPVVDPFTKQPFPGNKITVISPLSAKILNDFYPLPNLPGVPNFLNNEGRRSDSDQYHGRVDFQESAKASWFFRYS